MCIRDRASPSPSAAPSSSVMGLPSASTAVTPVPDVYKRQPLQRNHGRWLGRNLLIAVAGISALLAAQSFEAPCEIPWYLPLGQGSVPATIVDVAVASLVSCALIIAGNRGGRALASVPLAIASASCCLMGLAVQGTGEPLSIFGLILMSAGGTVLLFCWLAAVCAQRDIGIVELLSLIHI